jgi:hypothetical protein
VVSLRSTVEVVMAKRTVADQFVEILLAAGVRRIYGVVGDSWPATPRRS